MSVQTYVTYDQPGFFMPEQSSRAFPTRDAREAATAAPAGAYAFTFHDVVSTVVDGVELKSEPRSRSDRYFIGGTVHTLAEVEAMGGDHRILLDNMRGNRWDRVIFCPPGNVQPFGPGDVLIGGAS